MLDHDPITLITPKELDELEALEKLLPGAPWVVRGFRAPDPDDARADTWEMTPSDGPTVAHCGAPIGRETAIQFAAARNALPRLIAEVRAAWESEQALAETLDMFTGLEAIQAGHDAYLDAADAALAAYRERHGGSE